MPGLSLPVPQIALPLAISFYTFQAISYLVDVARGTTPPARSTADFALYMAFFPQLLLGPIVRFGDFRGRLEAPRPFRADAFASGLRRFLGGLAKKVLLADTLGETANAVWGVVHGGHGVLAEQAWLGLACYALQLYFDFGGYSDMAVGLGRMFGFELPENFRHPYCAGSVRDFWRRWHVTLSSWLRDYLYIPLGGNRKGLARTCLNGLVVFAVCGLWHGAGAMFLLWGLWHGLFLTAERLLFPKTKRLRWTLPGHLYTVAVFLFGWVLFRSESLGEAGLFLRSLAGLAEASRESRELWLELSPKTFLALAAGLPLCYPLVPWLRARLARVRAPGFAAAQRAGEWLLLTLWGALSYLFVAGGSYKAFLYAQF